MPDSKLVEDYAKTHDAGCVVISAEIESQLAQLPDDEQAEFLSTLGLEEAGLNKLIREGYKLLGLQTYFTAGPKEARAWTIHKGDKAPRPRASSTPISSAASSAPRPSPSTTTSPSAAKSPPRKPARPATKARNTSSRTAT